jgi:hypothetical protein
MTKKKTALDYALERKIPSVFDLEARIIKLENRIAGLEVAVDNQVEFMESDVWPKVLITEDELLKTKDETVKLMQQIKHCVFYPEEKNEK